MSASAGGHTQHLLWRSIKAPATAELVRVRMFGTMHAMLPMHYSTDGHLPLQATKSDSPVKTAGRARLSWLSSQK